MRRLTRPAAGIWPARCPLGPRPPRRALASRHRPGRAWLHRTRSVRLWPGRAGPRRTLAVRLWPGRGGPHRTRSVRLWPNCRRPGCTRLSRAVRHRPRCPRPHFLRPSRTRPSRIRPHFLRPSPTRPGRLRPGRLRSWLAGGWRVLTSLVLAARVANDRARAGSVQAGLGRTGLDVERRRPGWHRTTAHGHDVRQRTPAPVPLPRQSGWRQVPSRGRPLLRILLR